MAAPLRSRRWAWRSLVRHASFLTPRGPAPGQDVHAASSIEDIHAWLTSNSGGASTLASTALDRAEGDAHNAFITVAREHAMAAAVDADARFSSGRAFVGGREVG